MQIIAAALGVIGSVFFAIGIVRQSPATMAQLAASYFDSNPYMVPALAAQKADYVFGGAFIVLAFAAQLVSFLFNPTRVAISTRYSAMVPWIAIAASAGVFLVLRRSSRRLASHFERQIRDALSAQAKAAQDDPPTRSV
jgi:hypothetical protein